MDNNLNNKPKTGTDKDGNLQIRSSGNATQPKRPARTPARTPARAPARTPAKKPAPKQPPASENVKEYSFATSALFNNETKERSTDATAVSEAKKVTADMPRPQSGTRVIDTPPRRRRPARPSGTHEAHRATRPPKPPVTPQPRPAEPPVAPNPAPVPPRRPVVSRTRVNPTVPTRPHRPVRPEGKSATEQNPVAKMVSSFSAMSSVTKSVIYIAAVILVSIILSSVIITNANDVFAFVKDDKTVSLEIKPGTDLNDLAEQLKDEDIIKHKNTFKFFIKFRHKDSDSYAPGTYTVSSSMSYDQIISAITPRPQREMIRITVPEGYTVEQIIALFVEKGMGTKEEFVNVINHTNFDEYWFVKELPTDPARYYRLEGYMFPDTYYFYTDMSVDTIVRKFLDNFNEKFNSTLRESLEKSENPLTGQPFTVDEIITLGSIIQAEGKQKTVTIVEEDSDNATTSVDYGVISGVFHNRMELKNPMKLQSDATTQFALDMEGKGDAKLSDYTNAEYTNPYNTYYCQGLPPGAVCNPGINAISFARWPDSVKYYYFLSDEAGNTYFSETVTEHLEKVEMLKEQQ